MTGGWKNSDRRDTLPANWNELRDAQLRRDDFRCVWLLPSGKRCPNAGTDVDHYGKSWEHHKLRTLCAAHHGKRSAWQGNEAKVRPVPRRDTGPAPGDAWKQA